MKWKTEQPVDIQSVCEAGDKCFNVIKKTNQQKKLLHNEHKLCYGLWSSSVSFFSHASNVALRTEISLNCWMI